MENYRRRKNVKTIEKIQKLVQNQNSKKKRKSKEKNEGGTTKMSETLEAVRERDCQMK